MTPAPPRLPKWILKTNCMNMDWEEAVRIKEALSIAWATLEYYSKGIECDKEAKKAMSKIRRLGK